MAQVTGEVEKEDGVLVIRRIHVVYALRVDAGKREVAERVHGMHRERCPVYRSLSGCIDVTTELRMEDA